MLPGSRKDDFNTMTSRFRMNTVDGVYRNYATGRIMDFNAEIDKKVSILLDEERANKMGILTQNGELYS